MRVYARGMYAIGIVILVHASISNNLIGGIIGGVFVGIGAFGWDNK